MSVAWILGNADINWDQPTALCLFVSFNFKSRNLWQEQGEQHLTFSIAALDKLINKSLHINYAVVILPLLDTTKK